jgi:hypothetical protein
MTYFSFSFELYASCYAPCSLRHALCVPLKRANFFRDETLAFIILEMSDCKT